MSEWLTKYTRITMQVLMSDSLMSRVSTEEPTREKLLATFVFNADNKVPVTKIEWKNSNISLIGLGFSNLQLMTSILGSDQPVDLSIEKLGIYLDNIFSGTYKLKEHDNYDYELLIELRPETDDG